jgi:alpha-glucosidase (family GH31 glycosyl hydrolase)
MVPYLYSLHEAAHRTGVPVLRSFPLQEPDDVSSFRIDDQFFIGDDLMVAPLFNDKGNRKLYLPKGLWYDFFGETPALDGGRQIERRAVPLDRIPVYVRAGAVIPFGPVMQYSGEKPVDPLSVQVYAFAPADVADAPRQSTFSLYEDDGVTNAYQAGEFQRTALRFTQSRDKVRFEIDSESGNGRYFRTPSRGYQLHFHGMPRGLARVLVNGHEIEQAPLPKEPLPMPRAAPAWTIDGTGDVVVSIPSTTRRKSVVEFSTAGAAACGADCG